MELNLFLIFTKWVIVVFLNKAWFLENLEIKASNSKVETKDKHPYLICGGSISDFISPYFKEFNFLEHSIWKLLYIYFNSSCRDYFTFVHKGSLNVCIIQPTDFALFIYFIDDHLVFDSEASNANTCLFKWITVREFKNTLLEFYFFTFWENSWDITPILLWFDHIGLFIELD